MRLLLQVSRSGCSISSQLVTRVCARSYFFTPRVPPPLVPRDQGNPSPTSNAASEDIPSVSE